MKLIDIRKVTPLKDFKVLLEFTDDTSREVDLEKYLHGPIFQPLRDDPELFRAVFVEGGTVTWPNGADIDPYVIYHDLTPAWMEETETPSET
jgi:hypothetical protein